MIAILGAMQEEIIPILSKIKDYEVIEYCGNSFYRSSYKNRDLIIAYSKIGKVNSALTATLMIEKFKASKLLFSGVAGALNKNLKIKDLFFATSLVQYDLDISAFGHPLGFVPGIEIFIKTDDFLNKLALDVAKKKGLDIKGGIIATGDQFVSDDSKKLWIVNNFNADAVEMEGASVAQVCSQMKIPFFVLRAISDEAGLKADIDFDEFLEHSAKISADFILSMVENL